jgi:hypothetical protein
MKRQRFPILVRNNLMNRHRRGYEGCPSKELKGRDYPKGGWIFRDVLPLCDESKSLEDTDNEHIRSQPKLGERTRPKKNLDGNAAIFEKHAESSLEYGLLL